MKINVCIYLKINKLRFALLLSIQIYRYTDNLTTRGEKGKAELPARHKKKSATAHLYARVTDSKLNHGQKLKTSNYDK